MKKRILAAILTATMASSIFGMTGNAAERELNINWLSSRGTSEAAIMAIRIISAAAGAAILILAALGFFAYAVMAKAWNELFD